MVFLSKKKDLLIALLLSSLVGATIADAKEIPLLDQPNKDAKSLGNVDLSAGLIPIFKPKDSDWIKVADPRNGNVGWVKASDLTTGSTSITFTQRIITDGKGPHTYQVMEFGEPQKLTDQQMKDVSQQIQMRQQDLQKSFQKATQEIIDQVSKIYQQQNIPATMSNFPIIMPIVVMPEQPKTQPAKTTTTATPAAPTTTPDKIGVPVAPVTPAKP